MERTANIAGAVAMTGFLSLLAGALFRFVPTGTPLGSLARLLDSLSPWFLGLALILAGVAAALGVRRVGLGLAVAACLGIAELVFAHSRLSLPAVPAADPEIRILFFNALGSNAASADRIVAAALEQDPDVIILVEAEAVRPALDRLQAAYDFVSPCAVDACDLLIASKLRSRRFWTLKLSSAWGDRYAVTELETAAGESLFLAASQLSKPWLEGISETELAQLVAQYNWFSGPVVAVGDFNAAPWSLPMRTLLRETGMRTLRIPVATWPADAGRFGIPIDHLLVRGGPRVVRVESFGEGLGSNHLGLVAGIALP